MTNTVRTSGTRLRAVSIALALAIVLVPAVLVTEPAEAQTFKVLHTFRGRAQGGEAYAGLIRDAKGNLYGTTYLGGSKCYEGCGVVFKVGTTGKETVLYNFGLGRDGGGPYGTLVSDAAGNLYGTAEYGGRGSHKVCALGCGVVFKWDKETGKETVLYSFKGTDGDGAYPDAGLVWDANGNLYGTTSEGGAYGGGTVFKLDQSGKETVLYSFGAAQGDGNLPLAGLVLDANGNLYGTTSEGGIGGCNYGGGCGTVFKVDKTGNETVLYSFTGGTDGGFPVFGYLVRDAAGNLYGTTDSGGSSACTNGCGVVFKVDESGNETVLYSFSGTGGDGANPDAGLVWDAAGNLYGTTFAGGASGYGTVFMLDTTGTETVLHSFKVSDGGNPYDGLVRDAKGNLYGTTSCCGRSGGQGTVFELTP